jgi:hypothetical protein
MPKGNSSALHKLPATHVLCERCGYDIDAHASALSELALRAQTCPECGETLARSVPWLKQGSLLERNGGWRTQGIPLSQQLRLCRTWFGAAQENMQIMHCEKADSIRKLFLTNSACVATLGLIAWALGIATLTTSWQGFFTASSAVIIFGVLGLVIATGALLGAYLLLTTLEIHGMRAIARTRGWRITLANSKAIAAHASVGWLAAAYCGLATATFTLIAATLLWMFKVTGPVMTVMLWTHAIAWPLITGLGGLLAFEWLCWVGMRERKFSADHRIN